MKKRILIRLGLLAWLTLAGLALYLWWCLSGVSGIGRASVWRIKPGMTYKEVVAIIGLPPGHYRANIQEVTDEALLEGVDQFRRWYTDSGVIYVGFDAGGKVTERSYIAFSESFLDDLYQSLGIDAKVGPYGFGH